MFRPGLTCLYLSITEFCLIYMQKDTDVYSTLIVIGKQCYE